MTSQLREMSAENVACSKWEWEEDEGGIQEVHLTCVYHVVKIVFGEELALRPEVPHFQTCHKHWCQQTL